MYYSGNGVAKNEIIATELYQKAANLGNSFAMYKIALIYHFGEHGFTKNDKESFNWSLKSAENGYEDAILYTAYMYKNGEGTQQDYKEALKWYQKAADNGNKDAILHIAFMYKYGEGVEKDYNEAYKWYLMAAEDGNSEAMFEIGMLYYLGDLKNNMNTETIKYSPNYSEAMNWFLKAAEKNNTSSMIFIANMYTLGKGVKKDKKIAKEWNNKARIAESQKK